MTIRIGYMLKYKSYVYLLLPTKKQLKLGMNKINAL